MTTSADSSVSIAPGTIAPAIIVDEMCARLRREHPGDAETPGDAEMLRSRQVAGP